MRHAIAITFLGLATLTGCTATSRERAQPAAARADTDVAAPSEPGVSVHDLGTTWLDQRGDSVTLDRIGGAAQVVAFVYTSCHTTCPAILAELKRLDATLPAARRARVRFLLVSLDPGRDTPGRLAAWAAGNELDPARWTLLNGSEGTVRELAATLDVRYQSLPGGEVAHANMITVLDAAGTIVHRQGALGERGTAEAIGRAVSDGR